MEASSCQDLWSLLPEECKSLILEQLTTKQLARAAPISKEFADTVRTMRDEVVTLVLPPNMKVSTLQGMVAAHRNLSFLSFKRYGGKINNFVPLLEAATGNFPCSDIGTPVFWRRRSLEAVDFRGCVHLSDADIAELCWLHPRIEEVNLTGCQSLSDSALFTLSRHRRTNNVNAPPAEDELDNLIDRGPVEVDSVLQSSDVASLQLPDLGMDRSDDPGKSVNEGEHASSLAEAWPLPGAGVKPEGLVTRNAGSPGNDEKSEVVASGSMGEGALHASSLDGAWPLPGAGVKPEGLVTRNAGSPGNDEKSEVEASVSMGEGSLSKSVDEGEHASSLAETWPLPGAGVKPEGLVTRNAGSPGNDEKSQVVASVSIGEGALSKSALCSSETTVVSSYAQAAARASQENEPPLRPFYSPPYSDDTPGVQAEMEKIRGWPKKGAHASQAVSKARGQVHDDDLTCRTDVSNLSRSTVSGAKLRFASLMMSRPPDLSEGTGLKSVCLASCPKITDQGVQALLKGASKSSLVTLDISRCAGITNYGLRIPSNSPLENLTAIQMPSITRLRFLFSDDQGLRTLNLAGCPQLEELILVGPRLQTLNLSGCKRLSALQLKCPNLEALNMSLCENIQRFGRFECSALQNLNVVGCRLLSTAGMSMILESSNALEELRCSGCDRIDALSIPHLSLVRLEVSGCSALKRLASLSRILRVVDTCGCKSLTEIRLASPFLHRMLFTNCSQLKILVLPLEGIRTTALNADGGVNQMDDEFEISISGAYSLHEGMRKRIEKLSRQLKCSTPM